MRFLYNKDSLIRPSKFIVLGILAAVMVTSGIFVVNRLYRKSLAVKEIRVSQGIGKAFFHQHGMDNSKALALTPWPMFQGSPLHTGRSAYTAAEELQVRWCFWTDNLIEGSPALGVDGTIFLPSWDNNLYALNPNGTLKWFFKTRGPIRGSAAIARDGTIYVASWDQTLYALDYDGGVLWSFTTKGSNGASPTIASDGTIYFGSADGNLYALTPEGNLKWVFQTNAVISYSSAAIGLDGTVYVGSYDGNLYAIHPDGTLKWKYPTGGIRTSPSIGSDGSVFIGARGGKLFAFSPDGDLKWVYSVGVDVRSSTAVGNDDTIYFGAWDHYLYAIRPDGTLKWRQKTGAPVESSPTVGADGSVYVGSTDGQYYAFSQDGMLKWRFRSGGIYHSPAVIGQNGTLYTTMDRKLFSLGPPLPNIAILNVGGNSTSKDSVDVTINFSNSSMLPRDVEVKVWMEPPSADIFHLLTEPRKNLLASANQSEVLRIDSLKDLGSYQVRARLLDPINGELISESLVTFSLAPDGQVQLENNIPSGGRCRL